MADTSLTILAVTVNDVDSYTMQFSGPITYDGSGDLDSFSVNGGFPDPGGVTQVAADSLNLSFAGLAGSGLPWSQAFQPAQIAEAIQVPESGNTV